MANIVINDKLYTRCPRSMLRHRCPHVNHNLGSASWRTSHASTFCIMADFPSILYRRLVFFIFRCASSCVLTAPSTQSATSATSAAVLVTSAASSAVLSVSPLLPPLHAHTPHPPHRPPLRRSASSIDHPTAPAPAPATINIRPPHSPRRLFGSRAVSFSGSVTRRSLTSVRSVKHATAAAANQRAAPRWHQHESVEYRATVVTRQIANCHGSKK